MEQYEYLNRLQRPKSKVDVVIDTDTYNEIDDQFAVAYALKSVETMNVIALYAAPFHNERSTSPEDGMEKSYQELLKILELCGREDLKASTFRGSRTYLDKTGHDVSPVLSPAAEDLVERSKAYSKDKPLYVIAIGAITNVASALVLDPSLKDRIVLVWLGGHALDWPDTKEFNMAQDVLAARIVFGCGVALVQLPCMGVATEFTLSEPEMKSWLYGKNDLCNYLVDATVEAASEYVKTNIWSRVIWDVTAVAWLISDEFTKSRLEYTPIPEFDHHYARSSKGHLYRYVYHINRDALMNDLVIKLTAK